MVLYNADGSRAEMSGNGIRCFAQASAARRGDARPTQSILTDAGAATRRRCRRPRTRPRSWPPSTWATVGDLAEPAGWAALGANPDRPVAHLGLGNPHTVVGVDDVDGGRPRSRSAARCPTSTSRSSSPGPEPDAITMRVHERGAGHHRGVRHRAPAPRPWAAAALGPRRRRRRGTRGAHGRRQCQEWRSTDPAPGRVTLTGPATYVAHDRDPATAMSNPYNEALGATLIERTIRERIVLVGVDVPRRDRRRDTEASLDELAALDRHRRRRRGRPDGAAPRPPRPHVVHRQGQGRGAARAVPRGRRRHGRVRQRAQPRPSSTTWRSCSAARRSTAPR